MKKCIYCLTPFSAERMMAHCLAQECRSKYHADKNDGLAFVLLPKQGFTYVFKADTKSSSGRSSGR